MLITQKSYPILFIIIAAALLFIPAMPNGSSNIIVSFPKVAPILVFGQPISRPDPGVSIGPLSLHDTTFSPGQTHTGVSVNVSDPEGLRSVWFGFVHVQRLPL